MESQHLRLLREIHLSFVVRKLILLRGYGVLLSLSVIKKEKDAEDNKGFLSHQRKPKKV